jgi:type I restriction enzyme M protein
MYSKFDMAMNDRDKVISLVDDIWNLISQYYTYAFDADKYIYILYNLYGIHKNYQLWVHEDNIVEIYNYGDEDVLFDDLNRYVNKFSEKHKDYSTFSRDLIDLLNNYNHDFYESNYCEVLYQLIKRMVSADVRSTRTPEAINRLIAYFVNKEGCDSVFEPFCGSASILYYLHNDNKRIVYDGQDRLYDRTLTARVIMEALPYVDGQISCKNPIQEWNKSHYDAVISVVPLGLSLYLFQDLLFESEKGGLNKRFESILFSRAFGLNTAKLVVALIPAGFCQSQNYKRLRKYLVDNNYLDSIVYLPDKLLYNTSSSCVLVVCKSERDSSAAVKIIDAQSYYNGDSVRTREFDYDTFIKDYETDLDKACSYICRQEIESYDYNLNLYLYRQRSDELNNLKNGQQIVQFGSLMTDVQRVHNTVSDTNYLFASKDFSSDFIEVLLNKNKLIASYEEKGLSARRTVKVIEGKKYILCSAVRSSKPKYAIYTGKEDFACSDDVFVFEVNESLVSADYLVYLLTNNLVLKTGKFPLNQIAMLSTIIDSPENQKEIVEKLKQEHHAKVKAEQEADAQRLGVKTNISDLEHMLGTTYANMDDVLYRLGKISSEDDALKSLVKELKDNVEYLKRVIRYDNASITSDDFNFKEQDIEAFIQSYCDSWKNYSGKYFELTLQVSLGEHKMVVFDKALLKVMLDSILTNVERHGFDKRRNDANQVEITLTLEKYEEKPFVVMRVANNGAPFKSGFTINDYITRGRYSAKSGRSGLGGYHVYEITKGHQGFLYIDSNKKWNVIIEILLPINDKKVELENLTEYEHECI